MGRRLEVSTPGGKLLPKWRVASGEWQVARPLFCVRATFRARPRFRSGQSRTSTRARRIWSLAVGFVGEPWGQELINGGCSQSVRVFVGMGIETIDLQLAW